MRRYGNDYDWRSPGPDPNYRGGGYEGERMRSDREWQAEYGRYRLRHADDLGGYGGYRGLYSRDSARLLGGPAGHGQELFPLHNRDYGRDFRPQRGVISGYDEAYRRDARQRRSLGASRPPRYDDTFNPYGGDSSDGFSEGR